LDRLFIAIWQFFFHLIFRSFSSGRKPSIPSMTIEWLLPLQQLQPAFMQSTA
jgi:hypothetical protein